MPDTMSAPWRTRVVPAISARFDVHELHAVFFEPVGERTRTDSVVLMLRIPETPADEIAAEMQFATKTKIYIGFLCDTRQQANAILRRARTMLPNHRRMALERAEAEAWNCHGKQPKAKEMDNLKVEQSTIGQGDNAHPVPRRPDGRDQGRDRQSRNQIRRLARADRVRLATLQWCSKRGRAALQNRRNCPIRSVQFQPLVE